MKIVAKFARVLISSAMLFTVFGSLQAADFSQKKEFKLRGFRDLTHSSEQLGDLNNRVTVHRFTFENKERAVIFTSKIFSDAELTKGNIVKIVKTPNSTADIIALGDSGFIAPILMKDSNELSVITGSSPETAAGWIGKIAGTKALLRRAELSHPKYLDKWDRYCLGIWQAPGDFEQDGIRKTPDEFYKWMGEIGLNPQLNGGNTALELTANDNVMSFYRNLFRKYDVEYQRIEWLPHNYDLYNRNPFLTHTLKPDFASRWSYYGERNLANNPLRTVQNASILNLIKTCSADENQMGILDPDGEIGPFDDYYNFNGPMAQREFVRFLKEVRGLSISDVSKRYYGRPGFIKSWEDLPLADWREFYGWDEKSIDLSGEWRFMPDPKLEGFAEGWTMPEFNDSDWIRLYYPGDALAFSMASENKPLWMRKTVKIDAGKFKGKVFISLAPLSDKSVQVFLNGKPLGALDPHFHTAKTFGQFDITEEAAKGVPLTFVLRFASKDCPSGPIFLTSKKIQDFPTSDPLVNARRWDHMEFVDWAIAQAVGTTLDMIRSVDPDRPIKVHAYGSSPWGWKTVAKYGGYSHHTGSGPGWQWNEPKQFGASRGLQDSSETGGPVTTLRDLKGLWGNLIFMGKNAHDYFMNLQSITRDPEMRAYFEKKIPAIKVMGRLNVVVSPIAVIRGTLNSIYRSEYSRWELWRYGVNPGKGGELIPYLDEIRIRERNLADFPVIIDEGAECWDDSMGASLRSYVEAGGILVINSMSGTSTFIEQGKGGGPALAGIKFGDSPANASAIAFDAGKDKAIGGLTGSFKNYERNGVSSHKILPMEGTEVIGKWADGSAAFTRKAIGKGFVYCSGASVYPNEFIKAIASSFGPDAFATSTGGIDLVRTLRSNNGSEDFLMLRGLGKEAEAKWTLPYAPKRIYDPMTGVEIPSVIDGNTVTFKVNIPDWDFAWFAVRRPDAENQFSHWFKRQTQIWSGLISDAKEPKAPLFRHFDLNHGWKSVAVESFDSAAKLMKLGDKEAELKETELTMKSVQNEDLNQFIFYRRDFKLPENWRKDSIFNLAIKGQVHDCSIHALGGENSIYLNGNEIWKGKKLDKAWLDVTPDINADVNRLEIIHRGGNGIMPSILLVRSATPDKTITLSDKWHAVSGFNQETDISIPLTAKASFIYQDIIVTAEDKDKEVWLSVDGTCSYSIINGHLRYWDVHGVSTSTPSPTIDVDITPDIRFGKPNRIVLGNNLIFSGWSSGEIKYKQAELRFYSPGKWSPDGKGTREALTKKEIASVERDASFVQQYPMVNPKVEKKISDVVPKDDKPFTPPPVLMDLDFTHGAKITDLGPSKVDVKVQGDISEVSEAEGNIKGVYLHGESKKPAIIEMAPKFFRENLSNKNFTVVVWLKPMEINRSGGAIMNWGSWFFGWNISNDSCSMSVVSTPQRQLIAESIIRQRKWQCLALSFDGAKSTLYLNGIAVGCQTWDKPMQGVDAPVFIGSVMGQRECLNAEMASFKIFGAAMDSDSLKKMFVSEWEKFMPKEGTAFPEDDIFRLKISKEGVSDEAEIPAVKIVVNGAKTSAEGNEKPSAAFSGESSYLLVTDHPRAKLFRDPFSMILDFMPEPGTSGMIFRRHHILCLDLGKDGSLTFDANIGRNKRVSFPGVVKFGEWNRVIFSYDGKVFRLSVNGAPFVEKEYPGSIGNSDYTIVFFADNTNKFPESGKLKCKVRELRIVPGIFQ
jgi:hypothetical protein